MRLVLSEFDHRHCECHHHHHQQYPQQQQHFCDLQYSRLCYPSRPANEVAVHYIVVMRLKSNLRIFRCIVQQPCDVFSKASNIDDSFSSGDASPKVPSNATEFTYFITANLIGHEKEMAAMMSQNHSFY